MASPEHKPHWRLEPLESISAKVQDGTHFSPQTTHGPYRYVTSKNIRYGYLDLADCGWISEGEHRAIYNRCDVRFGDVLLTKDGANTGNAALNPITEEISLLSSVAFIRSDERCLCPQYLLQYLLSPQGQRRLQDLMSGNAIRRLTLAKIKLFEIPCPPLLEQRKIAEILDILDDAIRTTEQLIAKLEQVKQGLLQDLLTRGIDDNGGLRDPVRHPEQFKDSVLGRIPKEWDVAPLAEFESADRPYLKTGPFGSSLKQEHWVPEGRPVVTIGSLGEGEFIESELLYINENTAASLSSYALAPGDVVFSRVADVGRAVLVTEDQRGWIMSSNIMWISLDSQRTIPSFVQVNISANWAVRNQIRQLVNAGGRDVANASIMNQLQLPWPAKYEQELICSVLKSRLSRIRAEYETARKLRLLKQGLMQDLLTGRVRVTPLLDDSADP